MTKIAELPTFLSLPAEIRLAIYEELLIDRSNSMFSIRSEDHEVFKQRQQSEESKRHRSTYYVKAGPYRTANAETSYFCQSGPEIYTAILAVNRQIHAEAAHLLYSSYIFDFGSDVESAVPFLQDRTPFALASVRRINLMKRPWPNTRYFDRYEWRLVCEYVAKHLKLQHLGLSVFGGRVDESLYVVTKTFEKSDFRLITKFEGMEWVEELLTIKGLKALDIKTIWERCPPPCSNGLEFFVDFSASIEGGFAEYLRENMVAGAA